MFLQILPPDFQYTTETTINSAAAVSLVLVTIVFGALVAYKLVKNKDAKLYAKTALLVNVFMAVIKRDLKIN